MLTTSLLEISDAYILVKGTIAIENTALADADANNTNGKITFKNYVPCTSCISRINNTQIDDAQCFDVVMSLYNLIEYSDNYSKTSRILREYGRDELDTNINNNDIIDFIGFTDANLIDSFNLKVKLTGNTGDNGSQNVEIMVTLNYLRNFWRTPMALWWLIMYQIKMQHFQ